MCCNKHCLAPCARPASGPASWISAKIATAIRLAKCAACAGQQDWSIGTKRNIGTHLATGEFIASFDDDDLYAPMYLSTMVGAMQEPAAGASCEFFVARSLVCGEGMGQRIFMQSLPPAPLRRRRAPPARSVLAR